MTVPDFARDASVVLASWNGEKYVQEQLDSIASQSLIPAQILIRDDCSQDHTVEIIQAWMENHPDLSVTLLEGKENLGYIGNFQKLLEASDSEWIFLCDQDDRWHADKVRIMLEMVQKHPDIKLLASSFQFMNKEGICYDAGLRPGWSNNNLIPWQIPNPDGINQISEEQMLLHNYFQGCAMLVHRSVIQAYLDVAPIPLAHDWALAYIAAAQNGLAYLDRKLFDYRIHEANTTGLPQASKRSKIRTLKTWFNWYYRLAVVEDMERVLLMVDHAFPQYWRQQLQERLNFCQSYLKTMKSKQFFAYCRLYSTPGRKACMSRKEFFVGSVFIALAHVFRFPKEKLK